MPSEDSPGLDTRVLIHAPFGRDGQLIRRELESSGFAARECKSVEELCGAIRAGVGAVLIADEALSAEAVGLLAHEIAEQPAWSDLPLIVMMPGGRATRATRERLRRSEPLGYVTLIERPLRPETLVSTLRIALRTRVRQYELAEHLQQIEASERALRRSEARFRLLSDLGKLMRSAKEDVPSAVARALGQHLGASACAWGSVNGGEFRLEHEYVSTGQRTILGTYPLSGFGDGPVSELAAGRAIAIPDAEAVPWARGLLSSLSARAAIMCPLLSDGQLVAFMAVYQATRREWAGDEVDLARDVVERCWAHMERERLMAELAANNEALRVTNQDLMRANSELEEFAFVASHDLREPIRMVKIYTELILRQMEGASADLIRYGEFIRKGAGRMEVLVRDLATFSRVVHAEGEEGSRADLTTALAEAMFALTGVIKESDALIQASPLPEVRGDVGQLAHVFQNLISNSIKYAQAGRTPEMYITAERTDGYWTIEFRDCGIGFEQQYAERIFGLFKRLHKEAYPGTGLGLAICQRIVERYGGRMWAKGVPGEGSSFYFTLPA